MVIRTALAVVGLLMLVLIVGCAAPATVPLEEATEDAAAEMGALYAGEVSQPTAPEEVVVVSSTVSVEASMPGLSPRTTRGHVWAEPHIDGDTLALSAAIAALGDHVHMEVPGADGVAGFIGYFAADEFYLRATVCPNCGAERIEWGGTLLVCRACSTTFDLLTGYASGGGQGYPLGAVPYTLEGGSIEMSVADLAEAYSRTVAGERTLFEQPEIYDDGDRGDRSWPRCCVVR